MPTIKNLSYGPVTVELSERTVTLGPRESVEILNAEADSPDLQKYLREGTFYLIPSDEGPPAAGLPVAGDELAAKKEKPPKTNQ